MKRPPIALVFALLLALAPARPVGAACNTSGLPPGTPVAELTTTLGTICFELLDDDAPLHVENFLYYLENDLLTDTLFHRSVPGFVLQGGGFRINPTTLLPEAVPARPGVTVTNEPCTLDTLHDPGPPAVMICSQRGNERGTVALAKQSGDPNSGTTNWFINLADNRPNLDNQNGGFTVFARVFQGMDVVDAIAALPRATRDDVTWLGSPLGRVQPAQFTFTAPLRNPPLYEVAGQYGCFDPKQAVAILNPSAFPNSQIVADPVVPAVLPHMLSMGCGTPTTRATFVPDPGPEGCTDVDRIGASVTGPASLTCLASGVQAQCTVADHFEFSCQQAADALDLREQWRAAFKSHFASQLVYVTDAVPEPGSAVAAVAAFAALALRRRGNEPAR
jgi:cyclophilin family peptidyl-prolyl cis-trans isomerase